ncbi:MAG: patatin-like phospholipase family protein [Ignavibacteria bacterium]|jgi:predicted acylesterase/phospholipase RssA
MSKKALVISGGGSKGAFAVGAVDYLVNTKKLDFDMVAGTSTGSLISPMVVAGQITQLVNVYTSVTTSDIITPIPVDSAFLKGSSIFNVDPLKSIIKKIVTDEVANKVLNSNKQVFIAAGCLQTSNLTYFQTGPKAKTTEGADLYQIQNPDELRSAMLGSADQPVLMPPVNIIPDADPQRQYVDGGTRAIAPNEVAIVNGATELYSIILDPASHEPVNEPYNNILKILLRTIDLFTTQITQNDVRLAQVTNGSIDYLSALKEKVQKKFDLSPDELNKLFTEDLPENPFADTPLVKLFIIRPDEELPTDGLNFDPPTMAYMMELGRKKAEKVVKEVEEKSLNFYVKL